MTHEGDDTDVMSTASNDLFRAARRGLSPADGARARVRARVAAKVGAAAAAAAVATATSKAAATSAAGAGASGAGAASAAGASAVATKGITLGLVAKIVAPMVIAGAGVAVAPAVVSRVSGPAAGSGPAMTTTNAPPASVTTSSKLPSNGSPSEIPPSNNSPSEEPPTTTPATTAVNSLPAAAPTIATPRTAGSAALSAEEAMLVGQIDAALRAGDATTALSLASDHARKFPRGALVQEREGARVVARCMTGQKAAARAEAFLAVHPRSPMRARIIAACGTRSTGEP